ncbi:hypothetical protein BDZ45DRAFT_76692 [Acephala macrosclerotiorum]|nr:hypothetical protein BDZ45DRAFT_76692 [Acephala macrosclerotiorum]
MAIPTNFHLLDYQVTSNSWTFLKANVAIIVTCLPTLRGPIIRIFSCLDPHKKSSTTDYPTASRAATTLRRTSSHRIAVHMLVRAKVTRSLSCTMLSQ